MALLALYLQRQLCGAECHISRHLFRMRSPGQFLQLLFPGMEGPYIEKRGQIVLQALRSVQSLLHGDLLREDAAAPGHSAHHEAGRRYLQFNCTMFLGID